MTPPSPLEKISHVLALGGYLGLLVLVPVWEGWWTPSHYAPPVFWLVLKTIPLLFALRGMLEGKLYTYAWASMLCLFYFAEGVMVAYADPYQRLPGSLEILLSTAMFTGCNLYVRAKNRRLKAAAPT